ncbi:hypothetical protein CA13_19730 [Planctomycetes bacterium CA13]|uniref:Uncharacterized protein n=1 Tax=Novipirellula herctigrandis TaxID=2527986 RepID=A0A5C5YZI7_9BACT|nr:hypothetical protein CA13_19730 [Planctomycetes bacterium CA13]
MFAIAPRPILVSRVPAMNFVSTICVLLATVSLGCHSRWAGSSSSSIEHAKQRGVFVTKYSIPADCDLGRYQPIEAWVEDKNIFVVRLHGPHHMLGEPVVLQSSTEVLLFSTWSTRNGPPYMLWVVLGPLPSVLQLNCGSDSVELRRIPNPEEAPPV